MNHLIMLVLREMFPHRCRTRSHDSWLEVVMSITAIVSMKYGEFVRVLLLFLYWIINLILPISVRNTPQTLGQFHDGFSVYVLGVNPLRAKFFPREHKHTFTFCVICPHWYNVGNWNPSSNKTRTYLFYMVSIMAADVLATWGARASAAMILT